MQLRPYAGLGGSLGYSSLRGLGMKPDFVIAIAAFAVAPMAEGRKILFPQRQPGKPSFSVTGG
jgi:hypothetical protein